MIWDLAQLGGQQDGCGSVLGNVLQHYLDGMVSVWDALINLQQPRSSLEYHLSRCEAEQGEIKHLNLTQMVGGTCSSEGRSGRGEVGFLALQWMQSLQPQPGLETHLN